MKPFGLPRSRKITQADAYASALRMRVCARTDDFALHFMAHRANSAGDVSPSSTVASPVAPPSVQTLLTVNHAQLGLVISKRFAKHAVRRNLVKRLTRESFRLRAAQLPAGLWIVRLQKNINGITLDPAQKKRWADQLDELWAQGMHFAHQLGTQRKSQGKNA